MKRVNILDCTLRDGAYLIDSQFGNTAIKGIIEGLTESGIDAVSYTHLTLPTNSRV